MVESKTSLAWQAFASLLHARRKLAIEVGEMIGSSWFQATRLVRLAVSISTVSNA